MNRQIISEPLSSPTLENDDEQLRLAMEISQKEQQEEEHRRKAEEDELERILKLSLTEK